MPILAPFESPGSNEMSIAPLHLAMMLESAAW
jgi:hypothetical protein